MGLVGLINFYKSSVNELVFLLKAKCSGSHEDISDLNSSLSGIGVKREQCVELFDDFLVKDRVLVSDWFGHDGLKIFLVDLSSGQHSTESFSFVLIKIIYFGLIK